MTGNSTLHPGCMFVSIIIPTYNERENIADTTRRIISVLKPHGIKYEILIIDDNSPDGTARIAEESLSGHGRVIRRRAPVRSLSLSVLQGMREAAGDAVVVMDGDGNHPPELLPSLVAGLNQGNDLVIASRYVRGGRSEERLARRIISRLACYLGRTVTGIKDNTSGFFCIRTDKLDPDKLAPLGFKIGLEIFVKSRADSVCEIPFTFMSRTKGRSKFGTREAILYLRHLGRLLFYKFRKGICRYCR